MAKIERGVKDEDGDSQREGWKCVEQCFDLAEKDGDLHG